MCVFAWILIITFQIKLNGRDHFHQTHYLIQESLLFNLTILSGRATHQCYGAMYHHQDIAGPPPKFCPPLLLFFLTSFPPLLLGSFLLCTLPQRSHLQPNSLIRNKTQGKGAWHPRLLVNSWNYRASFIMIWLCLHVIFREES